MKLFFLIIISITLFNCSSNDDNSNDDIPIVQSENLLLKTITKNDIVYISYEYNEDNTVKLYKSYTEDGTLVFTHNHEYVNNEVIVKTFDVSDNLIEISKFYDLDIDESKAEIFDSNDILTSYVIYNFSGSSCGDVTKSFFEPNDLLFRISFSDHFDENCSEIITSTDGGGNEIFGVQEITRDDKNWFLKSGRLSFFRDSEVGNVIKYININNLGVISEEFSFDSDFEYNDSNYPISEKRTFLNGEIENYSYEYY